MERYTLNRTHERRSLHRLRLDQLIIEKRLNVVDTCEDRSVRVSENPPIIISNMSFTLNV